MNKRLLSERFSGLAVELQVGGGGGVQYSRISNLTFLCSFLPALISWACEDRSGNTLFLAIGSAMQACPVSLYLQFTSPRKLLFRRSGLVGRSILVCVTETYFHCKIVNSTVKLLERINLFAWFSLRAKMR